MKTLELFDLSGRVAIVTGGGTHQGRAMATALGELGAAIVIASRRRELCERVAEEMRRDGIDCTGTGCDATNEGQVNALVDGVFEDRGRLDVMVCNAGGAVRDPDTTAATSYSFTGTWEMNVKSAFLCAMAAARVMVRQGSGSIITLGSIHGISVADARNYGSEYDRTRSRIPYEAAKGSIINLTRSLAQELGRSGINVNCISPGQIPRSEHTAEQVEQWRVANVLERTGVPDDLKGAVALLASPAGSWITGHNLVVDGGITIV